MGGRYLLRSLVDYIGLTAVLLLLIGTFAFSTEYFFTWNTFRTIANQIPDAVILATGMTFVLIIAGIDLSVGSVLALGSALLGLVLIRWNLSLPLAILACLGIGAACGAVNGFFVIRWQLPAFIVTLGMLEAARGGAYLLTGSKTLYIGAKIEWINDVGLLGLSFPFLCAMGVVACGQFILAYTPFGRSLYAIGGNEEAARLSGIPVGKVKLLVYMLCGGLASLAAVIHCARLTAADPNAGSGYELQAIAAVVIGGTSLMGGRGKIINTLFGVVIIAVLENGLVQIGAQEPLKRLVTGAIIVAAVIIDHYRSKL
ncbi:MAG: ABC transporter permease [Candidatus Hydrogenedentes bacterium]|jgi:ribose transport system permease protein|nr:ABC transporter permease [Candidatus Hydrogenedentota bacterium]